MLYGISLWTAWVNCPGCASSQPPFLIYLPKVVTGCEIGFCAVLLEQMLEDSPLWGFESDTWKESHTLGKGDGITQGSPAKTLSQHGKLQDLFQQHSAPASDQPVLRDRGSCKEKGKGRDPSSVKPWQILSP